MPLPREITAFHRCNNFDFLRHAAAFMVICGHSTVLVGEPHQLILRMPVSTLGVVIFFSLSGYLVTQSWQRDTRLVPFFFKRSLRIFPALFICILLAACVLGPLLTRLSFSDYIGNEHFLEYFYNLGLNPRYALPGVFENNTYPNAVNGSLWTLPVEFFCYILIGGLALGHKQLRSGVMMMIVAVVCLISFYFHTVYAGSQIVIWGTDVKSAFIMIPFFLVGSLCFTLQGKIPLRMDVAVLLVCTLFILEELGLGRLLLVSCWFVLPYSILAFGQASTPIIRRCARFGDLSYGVYLYAFPVQQTLIYESRNSISSGVLTIYTTLIAVVLAFMSWHLIEKNALRLKPGARRFELDYLAMLRPAFKVIGASSGRVNNAGTLEARRATSGA